MSPEHGPILRSISPPTSGNDDARRRRRSTPLSVDEQQAIAAAAPAGEGSLATQLVRDLVRTFDRERAGVDLSDLAGQLRKGEAARVRDLRDRGVSFSNHQTVEHVAPVADPPARPIARGTVVGALPDAAPRGDRCDETIPLELVDVEDVAGVAWLAPARDGDETLPIELVELYEQADLPRDPWDAVAGLDRLDETDAVVRVDLADLGECDDPALALGSGAIRDGADATAAADLPPAIVDAWIDEVMRAPDRPRHHVVQRHGARPPEPTQELAEWAACLHECRRHREAGATERQPPEAPTCGENLVGAERTAGDAHDQLFRRLDDYVARAEAAGRARGHRTHVRQAQRGRNGRRPLWLLSLLILVALLAGLDHLARADTVRPSVAAPIDLADDDIAAAADADRGADTEVADGADDAEEAEDPGDVADAGTEAGGDDDDGASSEGDADADADDDGGRSAPIDRETLPGVDESSDAAADLHELVADGDDVDDLRAAAELSHTPSPAYLAELDDDAAGLSAGATHQRPWRLGRFDVAVSLRHADYQPITVPAHASDELWLVATWRR